MKKICKCCNKEYEMVYNFCPICGEKLSVFDFKKEFEPYLEGTNFCIGEFEAKDGQRFRMYHTTCEQCKQDSQKVLKRLVENKPDFLTITVKLCSDFGKLEFAIDLEGKQALFSDSLYLPVNKENTNLVLCLIDEESISELITRCQKGINEEVAILTRYNKLQQQLSYKKEEKKEEVAKEDRQRKEALDSIIGRFGLGEE